MRLNAYLARAGVASRRKADELIKAGRVTVNGRSGELNTFVETRDRVEVDGRAVAKQRLAYLLLHRDVPQARQALAYRLYPESTDKQARTNLRQLIHLLRQALPHADQFLDADGQSLQWRSAAP